jgi:DNA/RNA endonuclease G (NUC1)
LGSPELAERYVHDEHFLSRGHLAARADFIFGSQQRATFYYVNAAPQWHRFNAMNWEALEHSVRVLVGKRNINLDVYTGTFGIATLKVGFPTVLYFKGQSFILISCPLSLLNQ